MAGAATIDKIFKYVEYIGTMPLLKNVIQPIVMALAVTTFTDFKPADTTMSLPEAPSSEVLAPLTACKMSALETILSRQEEAAADIVSRGGELTMSAPLFSEYRATQKRLESCTRAALYSSAARSCSPPDATPQCEKLSRAANEQAELCQDAAAKAAALQGVTLIPKADPALMQRAINEWLEAACSTRAVVD